VWGSSYSLADCVDLSLEYPKLKNFFVKRLNVQITTPDMLVERLIEIARRDDPDVDAISKRLLILGKIAEEQGMDTSLSDALDRLQNVDFLPIRTANGHVLVGIEDVFAIPDHYRFGSAFAGHDILLDFTPEQTSILNPIFQYLDLSEKYLSYAVEEVSRVGDDVEESVALSQLLQMKAYALYW
jgi:hypothetical protein